MEYYSAIKKNEILPLATTWMDLEGIMLSEISQRKGKYHMIFLVYVESKKMKQTNTHNETETDSFMDTKNKLVLPEGGGGEWAN